MDLMPTRYQGLLEAAEGYRQTGVPLVGLHNGHLSPAGFSDDTGIYYFVPALMRSFGTGLDQAINLFFGGIGLLAFLAGLTGLFLRYRQPNQRFVAFLVLAVASCIALLIGDVYLVSFFFVVATVPWILYALDQPDQKTIWLVFPLIALMAPLANTVRSHAGTGVVLFLAVLFLTGLVRTQKKAVLVLVMLLAASMPLFGLNHLVRQRDAYISKQEPAARLSDGKHPFWHSVYIGLGFLSNPYVGQYLDEVAIKKVRSLDPKAEYLSPQYDQILKQETLKVVREHPKFIVLTIAAKAGVIVMFFVIFANLGLAAGLIWKKPWQIDLAFACSLFFSSLFGLLVMPSSNYLLGFIGLAVMYSIVSINHGLKGISLQAFVRTILSRYRACAE